MVDGAGRVRPHWRAVLGAYAALSDDLATRAARLDRAAAEEGIASVLPGSDAAARAWRPDPLPLPLPAAEFAALEAGLAQRAALIEAVLADLYGPQRLLAEGRLPPALVFANPAFLRPCRDLRPPVRLHLYAADLIRGPAGGWLVLADRTAAPSGLGIAAETRTLLARVLPEPFRPLQVRELRPFFELWQDSLHRLAPAARGNPAVALLTPGVAHPHWFEHMLLSRALGCALVEPGDLTARGGALLLKTLKGLRPIDVLLRRLDGRLLDPLELDGSTVAGIPGLLDAARAGAVAIANHPGSALAEAPGFAAFLPGLAEPLLGAPLGLPQVPTLWLGDAAARARVAAAPDRWHVVSALDTAAKPDPAGPASALPRWALAARAVLPPSLAPSLGAEGLVPRPVVLRLFLVHDGARWRAMAGGLARLLDDGARPDDRLPAGGLCKDVWVMTEDRGDIVGPPQRPAPRLTPRRDPGDLPSRVADNLFWLGRSVERLDRGARLVRAAISRSGRGPAPLPRELAELDCLLRCLAEARLIPPDAAAIAGSQAGLAQTLLGTVREGREPGAVTRLFDEVARLTESVRDRLTGDMYATFTAALRAARDEAAASRRSLDSLAHALAAVQRYAAAVAGMAAENMVRGGGWMFLELGRRIERAQAVAAEIAAALDQPPSRIESGLRLILELCDSAITYRSRYHAVMQPAPVLDLVLADQGNPRGLAFQLAAMHALLDDLAGGATGDERLAMVAGGVLAEAEALVADVFAAPDQAEAAAAAPPRLRAIGATLAALSDQITRRYFALLPPTQSFGWGGEGA